MKKVLVTGAAGFIGSHLSERLLSLGYQVWGIDNLDPFYDPEIKKRNLGLLERNSSFRFFFGDIRDKTFLEKLLSENSFLKVIHLAAKAGVRPSVQNPLEYEEVNIRGTLNLLETLKKRKTGQFIFASSSSVYGANQKV
ncbi:MAG TPA: GDP-mannose 4,6-dehydratase, partial [Nitrospiria bacterium]|nr:GDP-mannose 4,6-dehydratase [Nitrospiria bacterium]